MNRNSKYLFKIAKDNKYSELKEFINSQDFFVNEIENVLEQLLTECQWTEQILNQEEIRKNKKLIGKKFLVKHCGLIYDQVATAKELKEYVDSNYFLTSDKYNFDILVNIKDKYKVEIIITRQK